MTNLFYLILLGGGLILYGLFVNILERLNTEGTNE